ncbi:MAG: hypothetical protein HY698_08035 [Deltaproteobacteria bacterium]|nr:hypothetical protein [Deltaproteobacteria bacterium]
MRPFLLLACFLVACQKDSATSGPQPGQAPRGLPPASEKPSEGAPTERAASSNPHGESPHANMGTANPHGMGGADPHAGVVPDPHAGHVGAAPAAGAPQGAALVLEGTLEPARTLADKIKPGDVVFLSVKAVDKATKQPTGAALAVDRLEVTSFPMAFSLTTQGAPEGEVAVLARIDRDAEARTREKGDIEGTVIATGAKKGLKLVLDKPVE